MAISTKNKNRIIVVGKEYIWWVFDETDQTEFDGIQVKIVCYDQTHFIKYGLQQSDNNRKIVLSLRDYAKLVHLESPKFENEKGIITKRGIDRIIKWCRNKEHKILYALDRKKFKLKENEKYTLLQELQKTIS